MALRFMLLIAVVLSLLLTAASQQVPSATTSDENKTDPQQQTLDERLLFFPSKYPAGNWKPKDLQFDDVVFESEDKTRLHGWYCPCENRRAVILISHGNAGHLADRAPLLRYLQSRTKVAVFIFDYRSYGKSEGTPTVEGVFADARAARSQLRWMASIEDSEMLLMGESLGGAIAVQLAAESAPRGLILQSTFSSLRDIADVHFPALSWLVPKEKLDSRIEIQRYSGPLIQSHGTADRTIPLQLAEKLFAAGNEPKPLIRIPQADHNNWLTDDYLIHLNAFVDKTSAAKK
ncbi:MAG: alpha/beta hydrolase [Planctomycetaceae bacterium]